MKCSDFLSRFSDYYDGDPSLEDRDAFEEHLDSCASCRRYDEVVRRGVEFLKKLPSPDPRDDFQARLQHSIYRLDEERRRRRSPMGGSGTMAAVAVVAILLAVLWTPILLETEPVAELPRIVVEHPVNSAPASQATSRLESEPLSPFEDSNLWTQSNVLLYRNSQLFQRHREPGLVRTGLQ